MGNPQAIFALYRTHNYKFYVKKTTRFTFLAKKRNNNVLAKNLNDKKNKFFLDLCTIEKEQLLFGIRAIIVAKQAEKEVGKVFIPKKISC